MAEGASVSINPRERQARLVPASPAPRTAHAVSLRATDVPPGVDLRHLRYFLAVFEELHFGRAAERLYISQPPLSQAIRSLETQLGVTLLERTSRAVFPTDAGRAFANEARSVLARFDLAVAEARRAGGAGSALRLGCIPNLPLEQLLRFLTPLREIDPRWHAEVTHVPAPVQVRHLRSGDLECGILHHAGRHPQIETEPLFAGERLAVFVPPDHRLAAKRAIGPDDLRDETLVGFPRAADPALSDHLLEVLAGAGYHLLGTREAGGEDPRDLVLAVAGGQGVAVQPASFADAGQAGAIVVRRRLVPAVRMPETVVAWRAGPPRHLRAWLAAVRLVARSIRHADSTGPRGVARLRALDGESARADG